MTVFIGILVLIGFVVAVATTYAGFDRWLTYKSGAMTAEAYNKTVNWYEIKNVPEWIVKIGEEVDHSDSPLVPTSVLYNKTEDLFKENNSE